MIIQVGFNSPAIKHPIPPDGMIPAGLVVGLLILLLVEKSTTAPEPAGDTEKELFEQTFTATLQSLAVTCALLLISNKKKNNANGVFLIMSLIKLKNLIHIMAKN
jgi:hypothetical protein